jgi:hypothetical protein
MICENISLFVLFSESGARKTQHKDTTTVLVTVGDDP